MYKITMTTGSSNMLRAPAGFAVGQTGAKNGGNI